MADLKRRAFTQSIREIEVLREALDMQFMSLNHYLVLLHIYDMEHPEGIQIPKLADMCNLKTPTATRIVQSLGSQGRDGAGGAGLITAEREGRMLTIRLTDKGRAIKQKMHKALEGSATNRMLSLQDAALFDADDRAEKKPRNVTVKPMGIKAKAMVGKLDIEVHSWPSRFHVDQLIRGRRNAERDGKSFFEWSAFQFELLDVREALKKTANKELQRGKERGIWFYWPMDKNPKKDLPSGMQKTVGKLELDEMLDQWALEITEGQATVSETFHNINYFLNTGEAGRVRNKLTGMLADIDTKWIKQRISDNTVKKQKLNQEADELFRRGPQTPNHMHFEKTALWLEGTEKSKEADAARDEADELGKALQDMEQNKALQRQLNEKQDKIMEIVKREMGKRKGVDPEVAQPEIATSKEQLKTNLIINERDENLEEDDE